MLVGLVQKGRGEEWKTTRTALVAGDMDQQGKGAAREATDLYEWRTPSDTSFMV